MAHNLSYTYHPINDLIVLLICGGPNTALGTYITSPVALISVYECKWKPGPCEMSKLTTFSSSFIVTLGHVNANPGPLQLQYLNTENVI